MVPPSEVDTIATVAGLVVAAAMVLAAALKVSKGGNGSVILESMKLFRTKEACKETHLRIEAAINACNDALNEVKDAISVVDEIDVIKLSGRLDKLEFELENLATHNAKLSEVYSNEGRKVQDKD